MKLKNFTVLKELIMIALACLSYSVGISLFLNPNKLAPGGVSGIAVIINHLTNGAVSTGVLIFLMNIPILIVAYLKLGKKLMLYTVYSLGLVALFTGIIDNLTGGAAVISDDLLINAVAGAVLMAVGIGLNFRNSATTGGTDIIVKLLRQKYPHIKTNVIMLLTDIVVITASAVAFRDLRVAMYAGITVSLVSMLLDMVLYGGDKTGLVFIISDKYEIITKKLLEEVDCGVTLLDGVGAYKHVNKRIIMVALHKQAVPKVKTLIGKQDEDAFMIVTSASQVFGKRFKSHHEAEL